MCVDEDNAQPRSTHSPRAAASANSGSHGATYLQTHPPRLPYAADDLKVAYLRRSANDDCDGHITARLRLLQQSNSRSCTAEVTDATGGAE